MHQGLYCVPGTILCLKDLFKADWAVMFCDTSLGNRDTVTEIVCRIMCTCMRLYFVYGHARSMHMSPITGGVVAEGELAYTVLARNEYR